MHHRYRIARIEVEDLVGCDSVKGGDVSRAEQIVDGCGRRARTGPAGRLGGQFEFVAVRLAVIAAFGVRLKVEAAKIKAPKLETPAAPKIDSPEVQALIGQAKPLLEQATQYIKDNKLDLAKTAIDQLMKLKTMLPAEWQGKIDAVTELYNAKKALGGLKFG